MIYWTRWRLMILSDTGMMDCHWWTLHHYCCWLAHQTCINRQPYNLYCVGADVKPCSINQSILRWRKKTIYVLCFRSGAGSTSRWSHLDWCCLTTPWWWRRELTVMCRLSAVSNTSTRSTRVSFWRDSVLKTFPTQSVSIDSTYSKKHVRMRQNMLFETKQKQKSFREEHSPSQAPSPMREEYPSPRPTLVGPLQHLDHSKTRTKLMVCDYWVVRFWICSDLILTWDHVFFWRV